MDDPDPLDVLVVGGGVAGLATAYELHQRGLRVTVLERAARAGGVILTERAEGFTLDAGPDALLIQKPAAVELCRQIGLGNRLMPTLKPRRAFIVRGGVLHPLPESSVLGIPRDIRALASTRLFSMAGKARMAAELLVPAAPKDDESIASFIGRRFGREAVTYLAEPLLAGIHAGDVERLSMRALFPRFVEAERKHGSVLRAFRQLRQPARSGDGAFYSLPAGLAELVDALVGALPADVLHLGVAASAVVPDRGFLVHAGGGREALRARAVVLATPAYVAADLVAGFDPELSSLCRDIVYASSATVALGYRRDQVRHDLLGAGFVVPRVEGTRIMAGSWVSSKWAHRAPEGHVLLRAFIGGARDPGAMALTDEELVEAATRELGRILGIAGPPLFVRLHRWNRANAQYDVGHLARVAAIERRLAATPGLYVSGSGFRGVGIPDCIADGRATAAAVATYLSAR